MVCGALFIIYHFIKKIIKFKKNNEISNMDNRLIERRPWKRVVNYIVLSFIFGTMLAFPVYVVIPYWLDLPRSITSNYMVMEGRLDKYDTIRRAGKSLSYKYHVEINGVGYHIEQPHKDYIGTDVRIEFLPHTKVIIKIDQR